MSFRRLAQQNPGQTLKFFQGSSGFTRNSKGLAEYELRIFVELSWFLLTFGFMDECVVATFATIQGWIVGEFGLFGFYC
jgi:hypothetical protein